MKRAVRSMVVGAVATNILNPTPSGGRGVATKRGSESSNQGFDPERHIPAAQYHDDFDALLRSFKSKRLTHTEQINLFKQPNDLLGRAIFKGSYAVPQLFNALAKLSSAERVDILTQTGGDGCNTLMKAITFNPKSYAVPQLLKAIKELPPVEQLAILTQKNRLLGYNALMLATIYTRKDVAPLLAMIAKLDIVQQAEILTQVDEYGCNALMIATQYNSDAVPLLLKAIKKLPTKDQLLILTGTNKWGADVVGYAQSHCRNQVPAITAIHGCRIKI